MVVTQQIRYFYCTVLCTVWTIPNLAVGILDLCVSCNNRNSALVRANFASFFSHRHNSISLWSALDANAAWFAALIPEASARSRIRASGGSISSNREISSALFPVELSSRALDSSFSSTMIKSFGSPMTLILWHSLTALIIARFSSRCSLIVLYSSIRLRRPWMSLQNL